jgi:hypothetical protein
MKKVSISLLVLSLSLMSFTSLSTATAIVVAQNVGTAITWKSDQLDLGEIPQNQPKTVDFEFKNTGNTPVLITHVQPTCGCTATNYTKTEIRPGGKAQVTVTYNAASKGAFTKSIMVTTNADANPKALTLKGIVI